MMAKKKDLDKIITIGLLEIDTDTKTIIHRNEPILNEDLLPKEEIIGYRDYEGLVSRKKIDTFNYKEFEEKFKDHKSYDVVMKIISDESDNSSSR